MLHNRSIVTAALLISVGIAALGLFIKGGIEHFRDSERTVVVKGLSERRVEANNVIWPLRYSLAGSNLAALNAQMESRNKEILSYLAKYSIPADDISVALPSIFDAYTDRYADRSKIAARYNLTATITVSSGNVAAVRKAIGGITELLSKGLAISSDMYGESQVQFSYSSLNDIKPEMIEEATKSARAAAEKFATDSESELGKIKYANQGQFTISTPDANAPHIKMVRVVTTVNYYLRD